MKDQTYRPNRADLLLGPASMVRGLKREYEVRIASMDGLIDGWDERDCTGERADELDALICPDYHQEVSGGAMIVGEVGSRRRRRHVQPVEAHPASAFAEVGRG